MRKDKLLNERYLVIYCAQSMEFFSHPERAITSPFSFCALHNRNAHVQGDQAVLQELHRSSRSPISNLNSKGFLEYALAG